MRPILTVCALLSLTLSLRAASPLIEAGDRHYAARAEGAQGARASAAQIDAAIAAYERAVAQTPNDVDAHARLLRAYRFKGAYVAATTDEKKRVYGRAKAAGERALAAIERALASRGVRLKDGEKKVADAARAIPGAAEVFVWDAVNWGEWALAYGKLAAARQGAADHIRRGATIAHLINPAVELGAPSRVLGRLHDQTPRIPFITGWASSKEALRFLNESMRHDPGNKLTALFLAEAMVTNDAKSKPRAIALLRQAIAEPLHDDYLVEDAAAAADARALLRKWGVSAP